MNVKGGEAKSSRTFDLVGNKAKYRTEFKKEF
jgi:hypothetical protein